MYPNDEVPFYTFNSPFGNDLNINHPKVRELAERYCKWKGITVDYLIHHWDVRRDFERLVLTRYRYKGDN